MDISHFISFDDAAKAYVQFPRLIVFQHRSTLDAVAARILIYHKNDRATMHVAPILAQSLPIDYLTCWHVIRLGDELNKLFSGRTVCATRHLSKMHWIEHGLERFAQKLTT